MRQSILITEVLDDPAVAFLSAKYDVDYQPTLVDRPADLIAAAPRFDALIVRNRTQVTKAVLDAAARTRVIGRLGVGLDNIDMAECARRKIRVIPASGANADSVAEYAVLAAGLLLRTAFLHTEETASGAWPRNRLGASGRELAGKTFAVIGFGDIGRRAARKAHAMGMTIVGYDPQLPADHPGWKETNARKMELDEALALADAVTLHLPLLPQTRNLFDRARMSKMKPDAVIINTARGGIVDDAALVALLKEGRLGGAAIDVYEKEPLQAGSLYVGCPRLILTPHIAGVTAEANHRVSTMISTEVAAFLG